MPKIKSVVTLSSYLGELRLIEIFGSLFLFGMVPQNGAAANMSFKGKSLSEALIFASINPQYYDILFIELQVQYVKIPSSEPGENMLCTEIVFDIQNNLFTQHVLPMFCKNKSFLQFFFVKPRGIQ